MCELFDWNGTMSAEEFSIVAQLVESRDHGGKLALCLFLLLGIPR
jgi:hypothetical protein